MKIDMHVHTIYSKKCGYTKPKKVLNELVKKKLDGVAITDHNTIQGALELCNIVEEEGLNIEIIVGEEITTDSGEVLAYFIDKEIKPGKLHDVLNDIKTQNGIIAIPHPFDKIRRGFTNLHEIINKVDAIEVLNSRCLYNKKAFEVCNKYEKAMIAGSDAHFFTEIGHSYTLFCDSDHKYNILNRKTEVHGHLSNPFYLGLTKGVKIWREIKSGLV